MTRVFREPSVPPDLRALHEERDALRTHIAEARAALRRMHRYRRARAIAFVGVFVVFVLGILVGLAAWRCCRCASLPSAGTLVHAADRGDTQLDL